MSVRGADASLPVVVAGAGPCGLGLAAALARRGLPVRVVDPAPEREWKPRYGLWLDEAEALGVEDALSQVWEDAGVRTAAAPDAPMRWLGRGYALLDGPALRARWRAEIEAAGGALLAGRVIGVEASEGPVRVRVQAPGSASQEVVARVLVDASGHRSRLTPRRVEAEPAQTALGWRLRWPGHPFDAARAVLMDWSSVGGRDLESPGFLYVLPEDADHVFVEETVLSARPAVSRAVLEARLRARLEGYGESAPEVLDEEWCWIPMGAGPVSAAPGIVPFGGAAGLVHPASGYLVARALRVAAELSEPALWRADESARGALHSRIWAGERRRRQALYRFGLQTMLGMDAKEIRVFFEAFFALSPEAWRAYLGDRGSAASIRGTMWSLLGRVPPAMRLRLIRAGMGPDGWAMVRGGGLGGS